MQNNTPPQINFTPSSAFPPLATAPQAAPKNNRLRNIIIVAAAGVAVLIFIIAMIIFAANRGGGTPKSGATDEVLKNFNSFANYLVTGEENDEPFDQSIERTDYYFNRAVSDITEEGSKNYLLKLQEKFATFRTSYQALENKDDELSDFLDDYQVSINTFVFASGNNYSIERAISDYLGSSSLVGAQRMVISFYASVSDVDENFIASEQSFYEAYMEMLDFYSSRGCDVSSDFSSDICMLADEDSERKSRSDNLALHMQKSFDIIDTSAVRLGQNLKSISEKYIR